MGVVFLPVIDPGSLLYKAAGRAGPAGLGRPGASWGLRVFPEWGPGNTGSVQAQVA